jgi:hypothetical protein
VAEPIRFFFDQHIPAAVAQSLQQRGIDVLTAQDAGRCGLPDPDQLHFALTEDRVLVTFDSDYLALAAGGASHAGIAYCHPTKYSIGHLLAILLVLQGTLNRDDMRNRVEYL